jgi:hypothetical protein
MISILSSFYLLMFLQRGIFCFSFLFLFHTLKKCEITRLGITMTLNSEWTSHRWNVSTWRKLLLNNFHIWEFYSIHITRFDGTYFTTDQFLVTIGRFSNAEEEHYNNRTERTPMYTILMN